MPDAPRRPRDFYTRARRAQGRGGPPPKRFVVVGEDGAPLEHEHPPTSATALVHEGDKLQCALDAARIVRQQFPLIETMVLDRATGHYITINGERTHLPPPKIRRKR